MTSLNPNQLTSPGTANTGDFEAARRWLLTDLDRATHTRQRAAAVVSDIRTMGAHRHPAHLAALVLAVVIVANHAAFRPE
ncbi:hypothetical protein GCM10022256_22400 [Frondihabitans peucedani]|uniref:Uncharacterized protein n=1 Tax=Frondihabitans peucedani TaxID=598626 RepID=A0ABP8E339_9MICO